ncbi:Hsp70 family protein [Dactylosporangium sp. NPDC049742]|uniref:Hsp70 family protein n=1 Tax=Dactylosporangium sp. NPDC049742 TaxID=3154737 RepID=UPI003412CED9
MTGLGGVRLGVDFGTSNTVAVVADGDGRVRPLLFGASPLLPSAVFAGPDGVLTGSDAERAGLGAPAGLELNPKRRIDDGTVWLGEEEHAVADLIAAVLGRVGDEAARVGGGTLAEVVLTHPAGWAARRLGVLASAAERAGLGPVRLLPEPVAAAAYYVDVLGEELAPGRCLLVYDLGAGTFDVAVVRRTDDGFAVVSADGLGDVGGLDIDAAVVEHARRAGGSGEAWGRLDWPQTADDLRARHLLWQDARAAKEQLTRRPGAEVRVPLVEAAAHLSREEFEALVRPLLERTVAWTVRVLREARVPREQVAGVFLVGGSSRIPLVATLLHRALRIAPTALDHPELVVAEGSLHAPAALRTPAVPAGVAATEALTGVAATEAPAGAAATEALAGAAATEAPAERPAAVAVTAAGAETEDAGPQWPADVTAEPGTGTGGATPAAGELAHAVQPGKTPKAAAGPAVLAALAVLLVVVAVLVAVLPDRDQTPEDRTSERLVGELKLGASPQDMAFSLDDKKLVVAVGETAELWDVAGRQRIGQPFTGHGGGTYGGRVNAVAFSPDGDTFATASQDGTVRLWSMRTNAQVGQPLVNRPDINPNDDWRYSVEFNAGGTRLLSAGLRGTAVWEVASRARITRVDGGPWDATFNAAGDRIATGDEASLATMWLVPGGGQFGRAFAGHSRASNVSSNVFAVTFNRDGTLLATAGGDGTVRLWDVASQTQSGEPIAVREAEDVAFTADGQYLATAGAEGARLWRVSDHQPVLGPLDSSEGYGAEKLAFSHDGRVLAVAQSGGFHVFLWDVSAV